MSPRLRAFPSWSSYPFRILRTNVSAPSSPLTSTNTTNLKRHYEQVASLLKNDRNGRRTKKRMDDLERYRHAARWIPRVIDPFLDIRNVFRAGARADIDIAIATAREAGDEDTAADLELSADPDPALEAMKPEKRARYVDAYNRMLALVPGFRDTLTELSDTNELEGFIGMIDGHHRQARSDDTSSLRGKNGLYYLAETNLMTREEYVGHAQLHKTQLGFNSVITAEHLCPAKLFESFMLDPVGMSAKLLAGESTDVRVTANRWPAFMLPDPAKYVPGTDVDLCRGPVPVRTLRHIYTSPSSAIDPSAKTNKGRPCLAQLHGMTSVTPRMIAYAMVQTRYMLSAQAEWATMDGAFNMEEFFLNIVKLFESDPNSDWATSTLEWWNMQVFQYRKPPVQISGPEEGEDEDDSDNDFARIMAARRRAGQSPPPHSENGLPVPAVDVATS